MDLLAPLNHIMAAGYGSTSIIIIQTYTAISGKVVGKSARDHPERYCGWFCVHPSSSRKFERVAREAMDVCLRVLKKRSKGIRFNNYSVRNSALIISHITFQDCRVPDNLS